MQRTERLTTINDDCTAAAAETRPTMTTGSATRRDFGMRQDEDRAEALKDEGGASTPQSDSDDRDEPEIQALAKTKTAQSIAETLPWYRELLFVALVCLAQLYTREFPSSLPYRFRHLDYNTNTISQRLDSVKSCLSSISSPRTLTCQNHSSHGFSRDTALRSAHSSSSPAAWATCSATRHYT